MGPVPTKIKSGITNTKRAVAIALLKPFNQTRRSNPFIAPRYKLHIQRRAMMKAMSMMAWRTSSCGNCCTLSHWLVMLSAPASGSKRSEGTRLNSSHTVIYTLSLHDALPIYDEGHEHDGVAHFILRQLLHFEPLAGDAVCTGQWLKEIGRHTSELQSHSDLHSFPTRRSSDL